LESKIRVENVYKVFGDNPKRAINMLKKGISKNEIMTKTKHAVGVADATFEVYDGETLVVMGLSGSGKSTLLRCINRLINPTVGKVYVDGIDVVSLKEKDLIDLRRKKFGMVFQRFALLPHRTVLQNVEYGLEVQGVSFNDRREKSMEAIELVGLKGWEESKTEQLSGGMQQRVGLARALAIDPDILLMDEAFSALDPLIRTEMQDELLKLESQVKKTILFITHDLDEALKMGDRVVLMKDGAIVQIGTPEEILRSPANEYVQKFLENVDITKVLTAGDVMLKPQKVAYMKDGPRTALRKMKEIGVSGLFVVDKDYKLKGYLSANRASKAVKNDETDMNKMIEFFDKQVVDESVAVRDLFEYVVDDRYPIAVMDDEHNLKGYIVQGSILAGLAERGEFDEDLTIKY
jgi:glycine betaine/proline transport system ATP-binding protein